MKTTILSYITSFLIILLQAEGAYSAATPWHESQGEGAKTRIIASFYEDQGGNKKLIGGIHFKIADGWKIYGQGSNGIGMPPSLTFSESKNFSGYEIFWPEPIFEEEKIGKESISYLTYKGEVILPFEIKFEQPTQVEFKLQLNYGLCKEVCIPASEIFTLQIPDAIDDEALSEIEKFFPQKLTKKEESLKPKNADHKIALFSALIFAIIGGAILNIMPCVLPVLSIKLMSIINHADATISRIRFAFLSTITGIISCFIVFAILASIIKFTGNSLGWGLQFQNPYFLIFLIVILVLFIGNLLGIFELTFSQFLASMLNSKIIASQKNNIFIPNFLSGVLAVLLATPCSAPFLGTAISFALVQNFGTIFLVLLAVGIGFSAPYITLIAMPQLVHRLPKPGNWMLQTKQLMAGLLAATVIWLVYVLSHNIGAGPAFFAGALAITILACLKIKSHFLKFFITAIVITSTFFLPTAMQKQQQLKIESLEGFWISFDEQELQQYVANGKTVVVDITADWCLSCKFNKVRVLQDKEVIAKLKSGNIVAMRGDITKPNEKISNFLHKNNRFAIPFNAVYGPKAPDGILASELLTKKELLEIIKKAE